MSENPTGAWTTQQARNFAFLLPDRDAPLQLLVRDNDGKFTSAFDTVFNTEDIKVIRTPIRAPKRSPHKITPDRIKTPHRRDVVALCRGWAAGSGCCARRLRKSNGRKHAATNAPLSGLRGFGVRERNFQASWLARAPAGCAPAGAGYGRWTRAATSQLPRLFDRASIDRGNHGGPKPRRVRSG
jgi:hypothetical protein